MSADEAGTGSFSAAQPIGRRAEDSALVRKTGLDEAFEERVWIVGPALEFGVILAGEEVRVIAQLD